MAKLKNNNICFIVDQEPISKGKGILDNIEGKIYFRESIKRQLINFDISAFNNDEKLAIKISFWTNRKSKFLLHNLVKNYLDLLHKPLFSKKKKKYLDDLEGLLFNDDSQIKILAAEKIKYGKSQIVIQVFRLNDFYQNLDTFSRKNNEIKETNEEHYFGNLDSYNELKTIGNGNNSFRRFQILSNAQKEFLYHSQFKLADYVWFLSPEFQSSQILKEKYNGDNPLLQRLFKGNNTEFTAFKRLKDSADFSFGFEQTDFKKTNSCLKKELKNKLKKFKKENYFIFPFLTPVVLTVVIMQSKNQVAKDIDNLVKEFFVKYINEIIKAPEKPIVPFFELGDSFTKKQIQKRGVINKYQIIEIDLDEKNSNNNYGWIGFFIGDIHTFKDVFDMISQ